MPKLEWHQRNFKEPDREDRCLVNNYCARRRFMHNFLSHLPKANSKQMKVWGNNRILVSYSPFPFMLPYGIHICEDKRYFVPWCFSFHDTLQVSLLISPLSTSYSLMTPSHCFLCFPIKTTYSGNNECIFVSFK